MSAVVTELLILYFYPRSPCGERLYDTYAKVLRVNISIHALLAESDAKIPFAVSELVLISIHALLAESDAFAVWVSVLVGLFLSTLSLRRATGVPGPAGQHSFDFYPRSPCGERLEEMQPDITTRRFLSTLSLRRATSFARLIGVDTRNFYPRSPCGERLHFATLKFVNP